MQHGQALEGRRRLLLPQVVGFEQGGGVATDGEPRKRVAAGVGACLQEGREIVCLASDHRPGHPRSRVVSGAQVPISGDHSARMAAPAAAAGILTEEGPIAPP